MAGSFNTGGHIIRNPHLTDLFYGFDSLAVSLLPNFTNPSFQQHYATLCLDGLVRCAEAIGAIPLYNPASYHNAALVTWQADAIIDKLKHALGTNLTFPNLYFSEYGLSSSMVLYPIVYLKPFIKLIVLNSY